MKKTTTTHLGLSALLTVLTLTGCAVQRIEREARSLADQGKYEEAIRTLEQGVQRYDDEAGLRRARLRLRDEAESRLLGAAAADRSAGHTERARKAAQRMLKIEPGNARAQTLIDDMEREARVRAAEAQARELVTAGKLRQAQSVIEAALKINPRDVNLVALQRDVDLRLRRDEDPTQMRLADTRPVTLEFRDANVRMIFDALSQSTGVNFIVDRDVRQDLNATIFLKQSSLEGALNVLTGSNQLLMRVLSPTTVLIYPNTAEKIKEYQDLLIRGFYLVNADAKQTGSLLRTMLKLRDVFVDEKLNLVVVRDSPEAVRLAERLVAMHDLAEPEVMLEVEVLEVKSTRLTELGVKYPDSFALTPLGSASSSSSSGSTQLTLSDLQNLNRSRIGVAVPDLLINLKRDVGDFNVLANPRIRARNREKARILIGDRVPVVTSSTGTGFVSQNVQYIEVGLKLEVEPNVYFDDGVAIKVALEVSSLTREVNTGGVLAYQIGTRTANTTLRLQDGETQLLAGLISKEDRSNASRIPGLGDLPVLGRLFSNQRDDSQKTEIVLSITPRLIRAARMPDAHMSEFWSGTESTLRLNPLSLAASSNAQPQKEKVDAAAPVAPGPTPSQSKPDAPTQAATTQVATSLVGPAQARVGEVFEVSVRLKSDGAVTSAPLELGYDAQLLEVSEVLEGPYFRAGGAQTHFMKQVLVQNGAQDGRIVVAAQSDLPQGVQADEALVIMRFTAKTSGTAHVRLTGATAFGVGGSTPTVTLPAPLQINIE